LVFETFHNVFGFGEILKAVIFPACSQFFLGEGVILFASFLINASPIFKANG
jgi:hypothetical protein